ncbi:MAG TPA: 4Fe-4S binding protein [Deltaproteobacteria bacterium]|nr:4Fe-4S binding protein [Deltaproteobacteria bacterium]
MRFQRVIQAVMLGMFLCLLYLAAYPLVLPMGTELFLRMDPLVLAGTVLSARTVIAALLPAVMVIGLSVILGRFFCSHICPMGTTIDLADRLLCPEKEFSTKSLPALPAWVRIVKYLVLFFILGSALMGISLVFLASPLSLITRLYGLIIVPVGSLLASMGLNLLRGAADLFGISLLPYISIDVPRYALQWLVIGIFIAVFGCAVYSPRFWCRNICLAGALLALCARKPLLRRRVDERCINCGVCRDLCPMEAIDEDPLRTRHQECIACLRCVKVCPVEAVTFTYRGRKRERIGYGFSRDRRKLVYAVVLGACTALVSLTGLSRLKGPDEPGQIVPSGLIRPPGALPEPDFLARCIRCGQCMKACPTNTLQPISLAAGFTALASPVITPARGPCEPLCNVCTQVCPTGAIRALSVSEKIWARVGTAVILRHKCIAWEHDRECLICDEVCPFDAVSLKRAEGLSVSVPFVDENRCNGCGYCEYYCPVTGRKAIVVEPMNALRLESGSFRDAAIEQGFSFEMRQTSQEDRQGQEMHLPGFEDSLPPGFTQ